MRFLVDMPASPTLVQWLSQRGHDAVHAQEIGLATVGDSLILARARNEGRIVITVDLDFGRLLAMSEAEGPSVILFRGGNYSEIEMQNLLARVLDSVSEEAMAKAICVVDRKRIRVTRLPLRGGRKGK
jgi:predicted nuclease of predicted toxin-antitoxin system